MRNWIGVILIAGLPVVLVMRPSAATKTDSIPLGETTAIAEAERLARELTPGQPAHAYWAKLDRLGYDVTAINYLLRDYVEFEVVRSPRSFEIQIVLDEETGTASELDVRENVWLAPETQARLREETVQVEAGTELTALLGSELSSAVSRVGDDFHLDVVVPTDAKSPIPQGATLHGTVVALEPSSGPVHPSFITLEVSTLSIGESTVPVETRVRLDEPAKDSPSDFVAIVVSWLSAIGGSHKKAPVPNTIADDDGDVELALGTPLRVILQKSIRLPKLHPRSRG